MHKLSWRELIPGGKGEGQGPDDFDPQQLQMGQDVEMEHTTVPDIATEIAMDHLTEDRRYYDKLKQIEPNHARTWRKLLIG